MWKSQIQKAIRQVRIVCKTTPECHGLTQFVETRIPELKMLSPNTFYHISEIHEDFKTEGHVHFVFGDGFDTIHEVEASGVSPQEWEAIFKEKVAVGLTLPRGEITSNLDRCLPVDIVEAYKYVEIDDDAF